MKKQMSAFGECSALTKVTMADSVDTMGTQVFCKCSSLQNVTLSHSLKRLPSYTFDACAALTTLTIPEGIEVINVSSVSGNLFMYCT